MSVIIIILLTDQPEIILSTARTTKKSVVFALLTNITTLEPQYLKVKDTAHY